MPNHCDSWLTVEGEPKLINKMMQQVEITESEATSEHGATLFSCHRVIPRPAEQDTNWYDWNVANWGTKWDVCDLELAENDWENGSVTYSFWTAWSPIEPVIQKLSEDNPKLKFTFKFVDEFFQWWGTHQYVNGNCVVLDEGEPTTREDERYAHVPCEVLEDYGRGTEHHSCHECGEYGMECKGDDVPSHEYVCEDCQSSLEVLDESLWEEEEHDERSEGEGQSQEGQNSTKQLSLH